MTDDLRQKLTEALRYSPNAPWLRAGDADLTPSYVDALMPVITEALAEAWDDGYEEHAAPHSLDPSNPWRQQ